jgi:predicted ArsR family transcriptional regulator
MLRRLIQAVAGGRSGNTRELAEALGASPSVVEAMMEELVRRGLAQRADECAPGCGDCPVSGVCASRGAGGIWVLTRAGREAAAR